MRCGENLNLDQLLTDPLIRMVMLSDRVDEVEIRALMSRARRRGKASDELETKAIH